MALQTTFGEDEPKRDGQARTHGPCLFLVLEASRPSGGGSAYPLAQIHSVKVGRGEHRTCQLSGPKELTIAVPDGWMSRSHVLIERVMGSWMFRDQGSSNGTRLNGEQAPHGALRDGDVLEVGRTFFTFRENIAAGVAATAPEVAGFGTLRQDLAADYARLTSVAKSDLEVLLLGESGTGKEVLAHATHRLSGRTGQFMAINCGAVHKDLLQAELFGAERGSFTGADNRRGLVRAADKGTLFLDEVGEMPPGLQVALLRVLEQREVVPVGGTTPVRVDFRLVCATHRNLRAQVAEGSFRADLFARIAGFEFGLWPLRQRREDLGLLIAALLPSVDQGERLTFSLEAARTLIRHAWPLNVRELKKCLSVAAVLSQGGRAELVHLPAELQRGVEIHPEPEPPALAPPDDTSPRDRIRRQRLLELLDKHDGNVSHVARDMGKARSQVQRWLIKYGLHAIQYRR